MKVIQFIHTFSSGGAEAVMLRLHEGFLAKRVDAKIVILKKSDGFYRLPDEVEILGMNKNSLGAKSQILSYLQKEKPDLILVHLCGLHRFFSKIDYKNIFFVVHLDIFYKYQQKRNFFKKILFKRSVYKTYNTHQTITVSHGIKERMLLNFKIDATKVKAIYNPFDFHMIRDKGKEEIGIKESYILHVGRFEAIKRHDILIEAFKKIENKTISLVLLGDGALESKVKKLVIEHGLDDRVIFLGWNSNPFCYIKNAKLVVLSSDSEALPNVLIESLILHTPIVSTSTPGAKEILRDALSRYLANIGDSDDLAKKMDLVLSAYPEISDIYYKHFAIETVTQNYLRLI